MEWQKQQKKNKEKTKLYTSLNYITIKKVNYFSIL